MRMIRIMGISLMLSLLFGCGSQSLEDFEEEGEGVIRSLLTDLSTIHSRDELLAASSKIQTHFERLVSVMIAAETYIDSQLEQVKSEGSNSHPEISDQLRSELNRLYCLEGGRQIIEKCQEKALNQLDAAEQKRKARKL